MAKKTQKHPRVYITVYNPICGWKAVLMDRDEGPIQTGYFAFKTREEAVKDAKYWAKCEDIPFID